MTTKEAHLSSTEELIRETAEPSVVEPVVDPVRDVLREAKEIVVASWTQFGGAIVPNRPGHCIATSIREVSGRHPFGSGNHAADRLAAVLGIEPRNLYLWNDEPGRTHAEVVDLFDRALAAKGTRK